MIVLAQLFEDGMLFLMFLSCGAALGYWLHYWKERNHQRAAGCAAKTIFENARRDAEALVREARLSANEAALRIRDQQAESLSAQRREVADLEHRLEERESLVNRQLEGLLQRQQELLDKERNLQTRQTQLDLAQTELDQLLQQKEIELQRVAHLTESEARSQVLKHAEDDALRDASDLSRRILEDSKLRAEDEARRILSVAIQRYAGDHTFETTTTTVALQGDDIKGRIIGREGRNIRAFEAATGVTVLIDDTPNAVVLSGFDPVRREIAREAMQRLILDGRIHPTRIEEVVAKVSDEMDEAILKTGEEAVYQLSLPPLHVELVKLLGKLRFRRSFSQNILNHSIEVGHLTGLLAAELGLDLTIARKAGLLHDIGKALNHEVQGTHASVGAEIVQRHGESDEIVNAIASHHGEVPTTSLYGILVSAADAISASRPGARSETMTTYIKRLDDLEQIGTSFEGVEKCFAVQAGRELRVMVQPDRISDDQAFFLARNIARKIEEALHYPGQIRVTVLRETRCIEFAK
jgi:ribonuclease Y